MDDLNYIKSFRFGFGIPRAGSFDPLSELASPPQNDPAIATELKSRLDWLQQNKGNDKMPGAEKPAKHFEPVQQQDLHAAIMAAIDTDKMFTFRLSAFWANHFSLGITSPVLRATAGLYETGALRPNIFSSFYDLLIAAELHPAMIHYLNLQQSIGPNSKAGQRSKKGFNENLGREILELHTLGVDGGYGQSDIIALSKILTGWMVDPHISEVVFNPNRAEPGSKMMLGKSFGGAQASEQDVKDTFRFIAEHPSTANHIGRKLALHFFGPDNVELEKALATEFMRSKGNLSAVYKVMLARPESSSLLGRQTRNDYDFLISALRSGSLKPDALEPRPSKDGSKTVYPLTAGAMDSLTQKLWLAPSPKGWSDDPAFWLSSSVIGARLRRIPMIVHNFVDEEPTQFAQKVLGPLLRQQTLDTVKLASNRQLAFGLVLASPEFNRR